MEPIQRAWKYIGIADHMEGVTYPIVKDPRLLLTILENVFLSLTSAVSAVLEQDYKYKKISAYEDNFASKLLAFKESAQIHNIGAGHVQLLADLGEVMVEHRKSPISFKKKDCFVICSDDYEVRKVGLADIRAYIKQSKKFVEEMAGIVNG